MPDELGDVAGVSGAGEGDEAPEPLLPTVATPGLVDAGEAIEASFAIGCIVTRMAPVNMTAVASGGASSSEPLKSIKPATGAL